MCTETLISLCSPEEASTPTSLALGSFDGLHAGHRKVIEVITNNAPWIPTVVSFWPHPREVLYSETRLRLDLPKEKTSLAVEAAIDAGAYGLQSGNGFGPVVSASDIQQLTELTRGRCAVKAVGGIKTVNQAFELVEAGATSLGTGFGPQLIKDLKSTKE